MRSTASLSVSRDAVPLPMAMSSALVGFGEARQDVQGFVPLVLRDVRVDGVRRDDLARPVHDGDLDAGPEAGVQAHRGALAGRGGEQQVPEVGREHVDGLGLGRLPQPHPQVDAQVHQDAGAPGPFHGVKEPAVGGTAAVFDAEAFGDRLLVAFPELVLRVEGEVEDLFLFGAEHREHAVRLEPAERLGEVEVVRVLLALVLLAFADLGLQLALGPHALPELADQVGVFGEPLDEDRAGTVQGGDLTSGTFSIEVIRPPLRRGPFPAR